MQLYEEDFKPDDLSVRISELLVATSDESDALIDGSVSEVLNLLREHMHMDVVFVSEFTNGERVFRQVAQNDAQLPVGGSDPLEETWCQRVVDGRLPEFIPDTATLLPGQAPAAPFPIGSHLSTPIVLGDGSVYGTLCCFSHAPNPDLSRRDLQHLRYSAQLTANKIEKHREQQRREQARELSLEPKERSFRTL